jgi:monofunctional biosynthetic peptidoglycan transglycosylase
MTAGIVPRLIRGVGLAVAALVVASLAWVGLYRLVDPPATLLMLIRAAGGAGLDYRPVPLDRVAPALARAVIAAEDSGFCGHHGIDLEAMEQAWDEMQEGGRLRGGSTISQQTAKNAFLWPARTFLRKGVELWFTGLIEALWSKRRILEVYLDIAEWGDGLYGAEAAAQRHFGKPAARLSDREAALLAAMLPAPRRWRPDAPTRYLAGRAQVIQRRMEQVRRQGLDDCVLGS